MQREISNKILIGKNISPFESTGQSDAIDVNYVNPISIQIFSHANKKVNKPNY